MGIVEAIASKNVEVLECFLGIDHPACVFNWKSAQMNESGVN